MSNSPVWEYPMRWPEVQDIADQGRRGAALDERDRDLEDFLSNLVATVNALTARVTDLEGP